MRDLTAARGQEASAKPETTLPPVSDPSPASP
jgi:hypothetical protein